MQVATVLNMEVPNVNYGYFTSLSLMSTGRIDVFRSILTTFKMTILAEKCEAAESVAFFHSIAITTASSFSQTIPSSVLTLKTS